MAKDPTVTITGLDTFLPEEGQTPTKARIIARQVAVLSCYGMSFAQIAEELDMSPSTVSKYFKTPECQRDILQIQNSDINLVRAKLHDVLEPMCDRLIEDITENTPDCYKAVKHVIDIMGFKNHDKPKDTQGNSYEDFFKVLVGVDDAKPKAKFPQVPKLGMVDIETISDDEDSSDSDSNSNDDFDDDVEVDIEEDED